MYRVTISITFDVDSDTLEKAEKVALNSVKTSLRAISTEVASSKKYHDVLLETSMLASNDAKLDHLSELELSTLATCIPAIKFSDAYNKIHSSNSLIRVPLFIAIVANLYRKGLLIVNGKTELFEEKWASTKALDSLKSANSVSDEKILKSLY